MPKSGTPKTDGKLQQAQAQAQQAQAQAQKQQAEQQYVDALLSGKVPIPNALVGYLVDELKGNNTEMRAVAQTNRQAREVAEQTQQRMIELRGIGKKYMEDIIAHKDKDDSEDRRIITPATIPQPRV